MEYSTLYASLCCYVVYFVLIALNMTECSKIEFDLFPMGEGAIPIYIDSMRKKYPCQLYYYYSELTLLFFLSILSLLSNQQQLFIFQ